MHWPEAVQHLRCTYATEQTITQTLDDFEDVRQTETENGTAFVAILNNAACLCGNVYEEDEKINVYIKGLVPALTTFEKRFPNATPRYELSIERIVQFA